MIPDAIVERLELVADVVVGSFAESLAAGLPLEVLIDVAERWRSGEGVVVPAEISGADFVEALCAAIAAWEDRVDVGREMIPEVLTAVGAMIVARLEDLVEQHRG